PRSSPDGELALHAGLAVTVDGAVERVRPRLELRHHGRGAALRDGVAVLVDALALDRDRMRDHGGVAHLEGHGAGLGAQLARVELQRAGIGRELDGLATAR